MSTLVLTLVLLLCPPQGDAKDAGHAALNRLKNRSSAPARLATIPFASFINLVLGSSSGVGVSLDGWVIKTKRSGLESCNCHDPKLRDVHIYLGPRAGAALSECVIVEITPRWQAKVKTPATGAHVRVQGWAFYDFQHEKGAEKWRATAWEIHPVTGWRKLP